MKARSLLRAPKGRSNVWLTTGAVAQAIGCSPRYAARLIDSGRLIGYRLPGSKHRRVTAESLLAYMEHHGIRRAKGC
jgi:excisionase family DNA binding protein